LFLTERGDERPGGAPAPQARCLADPAARRGIRGLAGAPVPRAAAEDRASRAHRMTTLVSDLASAYLRLRSLDEELEIARRTLDSRRA
jgi:hypothetical protein